MADVRKYGFSLLHLMLKVDKASECVAFYKEKLGMKVLSTIETDKNIVSVLGFGGESGQKMTRDCGCLELVSLKNKGSTKKLVG